MPKCSSAFQPCNTFKRGIQSRLAAFPLPYISAILIFVPIEPKGCLNIIVYRTDRTWLTKREKKSLFELVIDLLRFFSFICSRYQLDVLDTSWFPRCNYLCNCMQLCFQCHWMNTLSSLAKFPSFTFKSFILIRANYDLPLLKYIIELLQPTSKFCVVYLLCNPQLGFLLWEGRGGLNNRRQSRRSFSRFFLWAFFFVFRQRPRSLAERLLGSTSTYETALRLSSLSSWVS